MSEDLSPEAIAFEDAIAARAGVDGYGPDEAIPVLVLPGNGATIRPPRIAKARILISQGWLDASKDTPEVHEALSLAYRPQLPPPPPPPMGSWPSERDPEDPRICIWGDGGCRCRRWRMVGGAGYCSSHDPNRIAEGQRSYAAYAKKKLDGLDRAIQRSTDEIDHLMLPVEAERAAKREMVAERMKIRDKLRRNC